MPWAAGTFTRVRNWATDKLNAINPQAALFDQEDDNFASGLNNCVTKDGLNKPTATMDWNSQRLTALANATVDTDALNRITADGRYFATYSECLFSANRITTNQAMTASTVTDCIFNTEFQDRGANYDITTGIFTAPATGFYMFTTDITLVPLGTNCVLSGLYFSQNNNTGGTPGLRYEVGIGVRGQLYSSSGNNVQFAGAVVVAMTAADTMRLKWDAGTSGAVTNAMGIGSHFTGARIR